MESKNLLNGILVGAAVGLAIGILIAPHSGKETKRKILNATDRFTHDVKQTLLDSVSEMKESLLQTLNKIERTPASEVDQLQA